MIGLEAGAAQTGADGGLQGITVIGGVAPCVGPDAVGGGAIGLARHLAPLVQVGRVPIGAGLTVAIRLVKPLAGRVLDLYALVQPEGDKRLLGRPEFKAMFVDDLAAGRIGNPVSMGTPVEAGTFHVKACAGTPAYAPLVVAKVNSNFPGNHACEGLPTIQGVVAVFETAKTSGPAPSSRRWAPTTP